MTVLAEEWLQCNRNFVSTIPTKVLVTWLSNPEAPARRPNLIIAFEDTRTCMTSLRCRLAIRLLLIFGLLIHAAASWAQTRPPILEKVAKTYGLDSWDKIEAIRYT
jgi:hypothetical protein